MMNKITLVFLKVFLLFTLPAFSQMKVGNETLDGSEWLDFSKEYYKIKIGEDGVYRIDKSALEQSGFWKSGMNAAKIALYNFGKQQPIFITSTAFASSDYILFYGEKNRQGLDSFLYDKKSEILNDNISLISDTNVYFLVYQPELTSTLRYKEVLPNYSGNTLQPSPFYFYTEHIDYTKQFYKPIIPSSQNFQFSWLVASEGFVNQISSSENLVIKLNNHYKEYNGEVNVKLNVSNNVIQRNIKETSWNGELASRDTSASNSINRIEFKLDNSKLKSDNTISIKGRIDEHKFGVSSFEITYPRKYDYKDIATSLWQSNGSLFANLTNTGDATYIFDLKNNEIIKLNQKGSDADILLEVNKERMLFMDSKISSITNLASFKPTDFKNNDPQYLIISSRRLKNSSSVDEIENYKKFRESAEGGNYRTTVLYAEDIYDQWGYGVPNHSQSFKNLSYYAENKWRNLEYIFIIGKGREYQNIRFNSQLGSEQTASYYVPTFGSPPSDVMLFSKGNTVELKYAVGRIAAGTMNDVKNYLDKIKVHEQVIKTEDPSWVKKIMHLGGGTPGFERNEISIRFKQMEQIINEPNYGGKVSTYYKDNSASVQIANLPKIKADIDGGLGMINFFGHAAVGTFDFTLDDPSNYANEGRLPFMFSLGCYSGNICTNGRGISENFVLNKGKGATGYIAASGTAFIHTQGNFGINFYTKLSTTHYNQSVGKILQKLNDEAHSSYVQSGYKNTSLYDLVTLSQQLLLHSDPAVRIWGFGKPDFTIDPLSVRTVEDVVNQGKDSFDIVYTVQNLRRGINDSISILLTHTNQDGKVISTVRQRILAPPYETKMKSKLNLRSLDVIGLNKIYIEVDADKQVAEDNENNNSINIGGNNYYSFFILPEDAVTSYPEKFSIVNDKSKFELIASTANAFGKENEFIFQLDTTITFNSSYLKEQNVKTTSSVLKWKPTFEPIDNKAYYWRIAKKQTTTGVPLNWSKSTFSYVSTETEGWRQQHQHQYAENEFEYMFPIKDGEFEFINTDRLLTVKSQMYTNNQNEPLTIYNGGKNSAFTPFRGSSNTLNVIIIGNNGIVRNVSKKDYESEFYSTISFPYDLSKENSRIGLRKLLDNAPDSSTITIFGYFKDANGNYGQNLWESDFEKYGFTLYNTFETYGAEKFINFKKGSYPYIFIFRKGFGVINEQIGVNIFDQLNASVNINAKGFFGKMRKEVGPVSKWENMKYNYTFDTDQVDEYNRVIVNLYTIDQSNRKKLYISDVKNNFDLSKIDAKTFPKLEFEFDELNESKSKPAKINHITFNYQPSPDYVLDLKNTLLDTIDQGDIINLEGLASINDFGQADSVSIRFSLINSKNERQDKYTTVGNLKREGTSIKSSFDTKDISGLYQVSATINYDNKVPEKTTHNNSGQKTIYIRPDKINPVLEVTFDGIRILDGDFVGANPNIVITVKDENKKLLINNKKSITYTLTNITKKTVVALSDADVKYELPTANAAENKAKLILLPKLEDGDYELSCNATDYVGNTSGDINYTVRFKVVSKKSISNLVNYPNPFSTSTKFVFDLTGEIPQNMKILIMTISGKVVREITAPELGPIKIGRNITQYTWNGTDDFGEKLANGVYLYKLVIPNSKDFEIGEEFTTGGYGKMMIVR